jgi:hypothetical protein
MIFYFLGVDNMDKQRRKELKMMYKEMKRPMGVFEIKNNINGRILLCSSTDITSLMNRYRFELRMGVHKDKDLQKEWNEFGEKNFSFKVLEYLKEPDDTSKNLKEELQKLEDKWLDELQLYDEKGYNKKPTDRKKFI